MCKLINITDTFSNLSTESKADFIEQLKVQDFNELRDIKIGDLTLEFMEDLFQVIKDQSEDKRYLEHPLQHLSASEMGNIPDILMLIYNLELFCQLGEEYQIEAIRKLEEFKGKKEFLN